MSARRSQGNHLEGPVAIAYGAQQSLCVRGLRITDNGDLSWLRKGVAQRLKPLAKAQRMLAHHGLHLGQGLVSQIAIIKIIGEPVQLQQGGDGHCIA